MLLRQYPVRPNEVLGHRVEAERVDMVLDLLAVGVRQSCEPAQVHSDIQIGTLFDRGRNVVDVRVANDPVPWSCPAFVDG